MLFSAQSFSSTPFSSLGEEIRVSYNGEYLGFIFNINQNNTDTLDIRRNISFDLIVT